MAEKANNVTVPVARSSIAVTGGTGDIGLEICRALTRIGVEPVAIDLDPPAVGESKLSAAGVPAAYGQADVAPWFGRAYTVAIEPATSFPASGLGGVVGTTATHRTLDAGAAVAMELRLRLSAMADSGQSPRLVVRAMSCA